MKKIGKIGYNFESDRYGILNSADLWEIEGLHCGDLIEIFCNGEWVEDRIEMTIGEKWYLVKSKLEDKELEGLKVRY